MTKTLKDNVLEIAEIAKACPQNLQEKCFTMLLEDLLNGNSNTRIQNPNSKNNQPHNPPSELDKVKSNDEKSSNPSSEQEDFTEKDVHVKTKKFLKVSNLTLEHINQIFYKEGDAIEALYEDLKTTKMAESQIRVALLQALKNAIANGNFEFNGEEVREEVQMRKCYDSANFTAHFRNNKTLFDGFEKYDKTTPIRLSSEGRTALANLVMELQ